MTYTEISEFCDMLISLQMAIRESLNSVIQGVNLHKAKEVKKFFFSNDWNLKV